MAESLIRVGVREFREELDQYLDAEVPVAITRHGQTVGYYIPARGEPGRQELAALRRAVGRLEALLIESGNEEDDVVREYRTRRAGT